MGERDLTIKTLVPQTTDRELVRDRLQNTTFVGIDFGTSTTVASYAVPGDERVPIRAEPIPIPQTMPDGATASHHLVPSVIAWHNEELFVGAGARKLKKTGACSKGHSAWSSFKMELGVDLGPQYHNSNLKRGQPGPTIERPWHAAAVFLRYMREHIEDFARAEGLPQDIQYSVSIPAAFEPNQREDLMRALDEAGIQLPEQGFIDEPNAAFLNVLTEANMFGEEKPLQIPSATALRMLVFDFGAGTCDISILEIGEGPDGFYSQNLAISRFEVLGGDNIDRQLVRDVLIEQLCEQSGVEPKDLRKTDIEQRVIPMLKNTAERLKIASCKRVSSEQHGPRLPSVATDADQSVTRETDVTIRLPRKTLHADSFTLTFEDFHELMAPFLDPDGASADSDDVISIFKPVQSAIRKARLDPPELDMVLPIGGSSKNPYVQVALHNQFEEHFVEVEVPRDLRAHVSTGTAINSLILNGLNTPIVKPITSESIFAIVRDAAGESLHTLIEASTEIPSPPTVVDDLRVGNEGQKSVQIPICVGTRNKVMSMLEVKAPSPDGFESGTRVQIELQLNRDKLLQARAQVGSQTAETSVSHPFANRELTAEERRVRRLEKEIHVARSNGKTPVSKLVELADACRDAGDHRRAAEILEQLQMMDADLERETSIAYNYERAGRDDLALKWAKKAYERDKSPVTARNVAVTAWNQDRDRETYVEYLEKALDLDKSHVPSLMSLGTHLRRREEERSRELIERAFDILQEKRKHTFRTLDDDELRRLKQAAEILGHDDVVEEVKNKLQDRESASSEEYDEDRLAMRTSPDALPSEEDDS